MRTSTNPTIYLSFSFQTASATKNVTEKLRIVTALEPAVNGKRRASYRVPDHA